MRVFYYALNCTVLRLLGLSISAIVARLKLEEKKKKTERQKKKSQHKLQKPFEKSSMRLKNKKSPQRSKEFLVEFKPNLKWMNESGGGKKWFRFFFLVDFVRSRSDGWLAIKLMADGRCPQIALNYISKRKNQYINENPFFGLTFFLHFFFLFRKFRRNIYLSM